MRQNFVVRRHVSLANCGVPQVKKVAEHCPKATTKLFYACQHERRGIAYGK
jgi:hypothetical protein